MNASRIAIIFALLNMATATGLRGLELQVFVKCRYLGFIKNLNYRVFLKEPGSEQAVDSEAHSKWDWYIFGGYYDKFKKGDYKISANIKVNDGELQKNIIDLKENTFERLHATNFPYPAECKNAKEFDLKVEEKGWEKGVKQLQFNFVCKGINSIANAVAEAVIENKLDAPLVANLATEAVEAKIQADEPAVKLETENQTEAQIKEEPILGGGQAIIEGNQPIVEEKPTPQAVEIEKNELEGGNQRILL